MPGLLKRKRPVFEPNTSLNRKVRRIELRTIRLVTSVLSGSYRSVFKGRGIDFDEVREYQEGDDLRLIDWNVTARMDRLFVKKFVEERELTVLLAVDLSASMDFASAGLLKRELAAEFTSAIALSAMRNHDRVGLYLFGGGAGAEGVFIEPKRGRSHVLRLVRDVLAHPTAAGRTDWPSALLRLHGMLRPRSVVFLLSDFLDEGYEGPMRMLATRHDVIAVTLQDFREQRLPDVGWLEAVDPETGEVRQVDTADKRVRRAYAEAAQAAERRRQGAFRSLGIDELVLATDRPYLGPLVRFLQARGSRRVRRRAPSAPSTPA